MKKYLSFLFIISLLSCSSDTNSEKHSGNNNTVKKVVSITNVETLFDQDEFDDPKKVELLKELKVCSDKNNGVDDYMNPSCSPRFFSILPFIENIPIENAFLIQIKSKTNGFPLRRLLVFIRERGELVKVNGFVANLIGTKKSTSKHDDLILRFNDKDQGQDVFYNCIFKWEGDSYKYKSVEAIEGADWGGPVRAELKDSISIEVEKDIISNKMIF
jgi:hypothetical protein